MTRSIKQLNNNLTALETKVKDLAENLQSLYQDYLPHLITVVKRQLMVATYQICTQKYPEAFLNLNYSQRTKLQEKIKNLARVFPEDLAKNWFEIEIADNHLLQQLHQQVLAVLPPLETSDTSDTVQAKEKDNSQPEIIVKVSNQDVNAHPFELQPEELIKLQIDFDDSLEQCLINLSNSTNKCLQEARILPQNIPNQILAIALQAEENTSAVSGAPNLLSILIEKDGKSDDINITPVVAICLRVNDLEFHDSSLNMTKQKIVKILTELNILNEKSQYLLQEYAIAQAEAAWRASWNEE